MPNSTVRRFLFRLDCDDGILSVEHGGQLAASFDGLQGKSLRLVAGLNSAGVRILSYKCGVPAPAAALAPEAKAKMEGANLEPGEVSAGDRILLKDEAGVRSSMEAMPAPAPEASAAPTAPKPASTPPLVPAPAPQTVVDMREGLLKRKGDSFPYNWSIRKFALTDSKLERFENKRGGASKGSSVFVAGACSVREADEANVFILVCGGKETKLKAASAGERAEWVADIRQRMGKLEAAAAAVAADAAAEVAEAAAAKAAAQPDLASVLASNGLGQFTAVLLAEQFALEDMAGLTLDEMKELGIPMAPRKRIAKLFAAGAAAVGSSAGGTPVNQPEPAAAGPSLVSDKFVAQPNTIRLGQPGEAAHGLADLMGIGDAHISAYLADAEGSIRREFATSGSDADKENLRKVLEGAFDDGKTLEALVQHPHAKTARLQRHHVLALRMYTTQSYSRINDPMRQSPPARPHPFAATTYFISEAIKKMRAVAAGRPDAHQALTFWRGMKDLGLSTQFVAQGGTEYACMSTSASKDVACNFAISKCPLVFKFVTLDFMSRGADIAFLSVYESEAEVLYPPLTYLRSKGMANEVIGGHTMLVATVEPIFPS
jgi:hypothetical protein